MQHAPLVKRAAAQLNERNIVHQQMRTRPWAPRPGGAGASDRAIARSRAFATPAALNRAACCEGSALSTSRCSPVSRDSIRLALGERYKGDDSTSATTPFKSSALTQYGLSVPCASRSSSFGSSPNLVERGRLDVQLARFVGDDAARCGNRQAQLQIEKIELLLLVADQDPHAPWPQRFRRGLSRLPGTANTAASMPRCRNSRT